MKNYLRTIALSGMLFSTIELFSQCAATSGIFSFSHGGKTYQVVKEKKTWTDAAACAVERGGYLVEINDQDEQTAMYNAIGNAGVSPAYTVVSNGGGIAYVWIGATDQFAEGTWLWDGNNDNSGTNFWTGQGANGSGNGTPVAGLYHNWGGKSTSTPQEPDNYGAGQHHGAIGLAGWPSGTTMLGIAGEWNDIIGSSLLFFIIEKDPGTGINHINTEDGVKIFPNTAGDRLLVEGLQPAKNRRYVIFDNTGREVVSGVMADGCEIAIHGLARGFYFIKFEGVSNGSLKFLKNG